MHHNTRLWRKSYPAIFIAVLSAAGVLAVAQPVIPNDAASLSMGRILSPEIPGVYNLNNPACLAKVKQPSISLGHMKPFLLREIGLSTMHAIIPVGGGAFAAGISECGIKGYRHFTSKMAYGMKLGEKLSAGVSFRYASVSASGKFNFLWSITPGIGLSFRLGEKTTLTSVINSPVSAGNLNKYSPGYPFITAIGLTTRLYEGLYMIMEISGSRETASRFKAAITYMLEDRIFLRAGFYTNPCSYTVGVGCRLNVFSADFAMCWSPGTGVTPALQLSRPVKSRTKR